MNDNAYRQCVPPAHQVGKSLILHVTGCLDRYNGAGRQAITLAKNLRFCNHVITYFSEGSRVSTWQAEGLCFLRLPGRSATQRYFYALRALLHIKPKVVHIHGYAIGYQFILFAKLLGIRIVLKSTLCGVDDLRSIVASRRVNRLYLKMIDKNNALSSEMARINREVIDDDTVTVIPNAVVCPACCIRRCEKSNRVLVVGAVSKRKGVHIAVECFINNLVTEPDSELLIIGPYGDSVDKDYYDKCLLSIPNEYAQRIRFTGELSHDTVLEYYRSSKALMLFSNREGLPNAVIEAMAYNCVPIVLKMSGVMEDIITNDNEGIVLESINDEVSWDEINEIVDGGKAYERARSTFDMSVIADCYREVYEA